VPLDIRAGLVPGNPWLTSESGARTALDLREPILVARGFSGVALSEDTPDMSRDAARLLRDALKLSENERMESVCRLLASLVLEPR
jgi:hypothetical protein